MKPLFDLMVAMMTGAYGKVYHRIKAEFAYIYVDAVEHTRRAFISAFVAVLGILVGVCGFLLIHVALYLYLPWSEETKALTLLGLGLVYFSIAFAGIFRLLSRSFWLKHSKAQDLLRDLDRNKP
jgi:hypothetical protein